MQIHLVLKAPVWVLGYVNTKLIQMRLVLKAPVWVLGGHHPISLLYTCWPAPTSILRLPVFSNMWGIFPVEQVIPLWPKHGLSNYCFFFPGFSVKQFLLSINQVIPFWLQFALSNYKLFHPRFFCQKISSCTLSNIQMILSAPCPNYLSWRKMIRLLQINYAVPACKKHTPSAPCFPS
jgi:hypothetical protein